MLKRSTVPDMSALVATSLALAGFLAGFAVAQQDPIAIALSPSTVAPVEAQEVEECPLDQISFEMVTGFVYTAPTDMLDSQPGTLMLTDCIDTCRQNASCKSINYETGLCVLFSSSADSSSGDLTPSQFPVFTIYMQKNCLTNNPVCNAAWSFERVMNHQLEVQPVARASLESRQECMDFCLQDPVCRGANWVEEEKDCSLLGVDRHVLAGQPLFVPKEGTDYLERNCIKDEAKKLCLYEPVRGKILKTVDSVFQAIANREDCQDLCNRAPYRCHSYDFNDTGDNVCRLSHHSAHTLTQISDPYLAIEEATTYELSGCYNVTVECFSGDMRATIFTTTMFDGKVYAKGSPLTCVQDVQGALNFTIAFGYNDLDCGVTRLREGAYTNNVVVQHHDRIVTSKDLGLSVTCEYDLSNKTVASEVDLTIKGEIAPALYEESVVDSPNVLMKVVDVKSGNSTKTAVVGDPLSLVFEIVDKESSPYEIFVRDLIAMDGATDTELLLVDGRGCPVEPSIMSELSKSAASPKVLLADFDAFRFPSSDMVQFRALITPCMPTCEPVRCDVLDYTGQGRSVDSYGRRKRSLLSEGGSLDASEASSSAVAVPSRRRSKRMTQPEEVMVVETLRIVDRYGKRGPSTTAGSGPARPSFPRRMADLVGQSSSSSSSASFDPIENNLSRVVLKAEDGGDSQSSASASAGRQGCVDRNSLIAGGVVFLSVQVLLLVLWLVLWRKKRASEASKVLFDFPDNKSTTSAATTSSSSAGSGLSSSRRDLSYVYDNSYSRRLR